MTDFAASNGFVRGFLKRHNLCNEAIHGQAEAVSLAAAAAAVSEIRRRLESFPSERIGSLDEMGLLYRCVPSRLYNPRRERTSARGTKAMRQMDSVTLMLCTNSTATQKFPVGVIGTAADPLCYRG